MNSLISATEPTDDAHLQKAGSTRPVTRSARSELTCPFDFPWLAVLLQKLGTSRGAGPRKLWIGRLAPGS